MKFLFLNDVHFDSVTPRARTDDYPAELLGLLDQVHKLADYFDVELIGIAGDVFHRWNAWAALLSFYRWAKRVGRPILAVPGNHDLQLNRFDTLPSTALGMLFETGALLDVSKQDYVCVGADGTEVAIAGVPWPDAQSLDAWIARAATTLAFDRTHQGRIVMAHCYAAPEAGTYWGSPILGFPDLSALPWDVFVFGHDHRDQGVHKLGEKWFLTLPALARGSLHQEELRRDVKVALVEFESAKPLIDLSARWSVRQIRLQAQPPEAIFDLAEHAAQAQERQAVEAFVEKLRDDLQATNPMASAEERIRALALPELVHRRVLGYLADAERSLA